MHGSPAKPKTSGSFRLGAAGLTAVVLMTACSGGPVHDRAGGNAGPAVTRLRLANEGDGTPPQVVAWADEVSRLSKGALKIDIVSDVHLGRSDAERMIVGDVRDGTYDMAWVGARVWDQLGVMSFQALLAPMLVDSYGVESKVFQEGIPAQMLKGVDAAGVVGIGVLPGTLFKVVGVAKPLLAPGDFRGLRFGTWDSKEAEQTVRTLGATPVTMPPYGDKLDGLDGMDQQLVRIDGDHFDVTADATTANLNLWPRPPVLFMAKPAWAELNSGQRKDLLKAVDAVQLPSLDAARASDQSAMPSLCRTPMTLPRATPGQLTTLREAVEPVYATLRRDPDTRTWLEKIQALKDQLNLPPELASCAGLRGTAQPAARIDGTYQKRSRQADLVKTCKGLPPGIVPSTATTILEVVFDRGTVTLYETDPGQPKQISWAGTYRVFKDTLELTVNGSKSPSFTTTWSLKDRTLTLSDLQNGHCDDVAVWSLHLWTRVK